MAMKSCRECGKEVSTKASKCPHCGVKDPGKSIWNRNISGLGCLALIVFVGLVYVMSLGDTATTPSRSRPPSTRPPVDASISFANLRAQMRDDLTEAQFRSIARGLEGRRIRWEGWVEDVNEKMLGGYELWVDMDSPSETISVQDVTFDIPQDLALALRKDSRVTFEGTIRSINNVLGSMSVRLDDVVVIR